MKKVLLFAVVATCIFTSCREEKNYFYTPTIGVEGRGGSEGPGDAPLQISSDEYKVYSGNPYMGDEGNAANRHYTPYSEREHNYNYYRGSEE